MELAEIGEELQTIQSIFMDDIIIKEKNGGRILNLAVDGHQVLALRVTDNYPNEIPEIVLPEHLKTLGLKEHITSAAESSVGSPMLFQMLDAAREWVTSHPLSLYPTSGIPEASKQKSSDLKSGIAKREGTICKYYQQGNCKFGDECRNLHASASSKAKQHSSATTNKETDSVSVSTASVPSTPSKLEKKLKRGKNSTNTGLSDMPLDGPNSQEEVKSKKAKPKKSPKQVQESEEDQSTKKVAMRQATDVISRILWDPDLPSEEFKVGYLDRFIGIMEKPFSAFSWEDISSVGASVLAVPKHRIQYFKYRDEIVWDKRSQVDNFFGSRGGKVIQDIVEKDQKEPAAGSAESTSTPELEENVTMEIEADDIPEVSRIVADKSRPNHFVCIHITNEEVKAKVQKIQDYITGHTPQLAEGCLVPTALHVTLCMIRLENEQQIEAARRVLEEAKQQFIHILPRCLYLAFSGVDNFRGRLVYVKVDPSPALERFVFYLLEQFQQAGIRTPGNRDEYTPHMTIVKLSRPLQRELHTTLISPASYVPFHDVHIGKQRIEAVQLCSMMEPKQSDGFYLRQASISNSLSGLLPTFASLLLERIQSLNNHGVITEHERDQLIESVHVLLPAGVDKFDAAIQELLRVSTEETMCSKSDTTQQTTVVILRGLPGSGKSFIAHNCSEFHQESSSSKVAICGADDYFMEGDSYRFNPDLLPKAHSYCLNQFLIALGNKKELIVLDNTNSKLWEYQIYNYLCKILGCSCHVLEVPCPNATIAEMYRSRNVHNIDPTATMRIFQRWDKDEESVLVPPSLAFPTIRSVAHTAFSLKSLCLSETAPIQAVASYSSVKVVYTAIFLSPESQWQLVSTFMPGHPKVYATHVTLSFEPSSKRILETRIGRKVSLKVTGSADNGKIQVVTVEFLKTIPSNNEHPHITISTEEGISPKLANAMLSTHPLNPIYQSQAISLEGVIGIMVREVNEKDSSPDIQVENPDLSNQPHFAITSNTDFHNHVLPKLFENAPNDSAAAQESELAMASVDSSVNYICTGHQKINQLFVFDFDGTLFCSPQPREGKQFYEAYTGKTWPHKGWLSWPESLLPPMKITPGPALSEFRQHVKRAGSFTIILTGRIKRTEKALVQVLEDAQVYPDRLIPKPDVSSENTPTFKARVMQQLLEEFPDVMLVKFWDDLPENLAAVHRLSKPNVQFEIINANTMLPTIATKQGKKITAQQPKTPPQSQPSASFLECKLNLHGLLPCPAYYTAATSGIKFLTSQFSKVVGYTGESELFHHYPFGSFPLGRQSDIDLCFLAPPSFTPKDCMEKFTRQLQDCGVNYIHMGYSSRCPRLKIMLEFSDSPAINFDIVFAIVSKTDFFTSPPTQKLRATEVLSLLKPGDSTSKVALTGPVFFQHIQEIITGIVSRHQFGAVVEMVAQVLIAQRVKGNAYHCIRTFHIVQLLADFIKSHKAELPSNLCCDTLFKEFITHASKLPETKWQKLFGEFVPYEFIPQVVRAFSLVNKEVLHDDFPSITCYEEIADRPAFPPKGYTVVQLSLSGTKEALLWKLHTVVEARLPSYIRQLLSAGLDVIPDGNVRNEREFCFAVTHTKSSKQILQQTLRPFWNELSEFRKQSGVNVELTFGQDTDSMRPSTATGTPDTSSALCTATASGSCIEQIMQFASGPSGKELRLTDTLSGYERLLVHETAERLGLQHTTVGTGKNRHIVLMKKQKQ